MEAKKGWKREGSEARKEDESHGDIKKKWKNRMKL
jgi:hypothetical protein